MRKTVKNKRQAGFSMMEMLIVVAMSVTITAIAIPQYIRTTAYLRVAGDLRSINGLTALAKMRAAASFTHARTYVDLDRKSTRLNSSHTVISYAVFCLKKKKMKNHDAQHAAASQTRVEEVL